MHQLLPHHWNSVPDKIHALAGGVGGAIAVIVMVIVIAILLVGTKGALRSEMWWVGASGSVSKVILCTIFYR